MLEERELLERAQKIDDLIREIDEVADPDVRAKAVDLVQSLMDLHGAGLEKMMEIIAEAGEPGYAIFDRFAGDDLIGSLLLLYGLHPHDLETRVARALEKLRKQLGSQGNVELLGIDEGVIRLGLQVNQNGCASTAGTFKQIIEAAILEAAPEVRTIKVEEIIGQLPQGLVQLGKKF